MQAGKSIIESTAAHPLPTIYLSIDRLEDVLKKEKVDSSAFETMPFHYVEIAEQLLSVYDNESTCYPLYLIVYIYCLHSAANDFVDAAKLRTLLKDIADQRGLKVHEGSAHHGRRNDGCEVESFECNGGQFGARFLAAGLDLFAKLKDAEANSDATRKHKHNLQATTQQQAPPARNLRA
jgi:hypothetical protein